MATYDEMSLRTRLFMRAYPFGRYTIDPVPCATMRRPLDRARLAVVTSAGLHTPQQPGFDHSIKLGDTSYREIPNDTNPQELIESHKSDSFDHSGVQADRNLVFPLDRLREMVAANEIGELNCRHFSFMGSIVNPRKLINDTAPTVARALRADDVDAVLLTPV